MLVCPLRTQFRPVVDLATNRTIGARMTFHDGDLSVPIGEMFEALADHRPADHPGVECGRSALQQWFERPDPRTGVLFLRISLSAPLAVDWETGWDTGVPLFDNADAVGIRVVVELADDEVFRWPGRALEIRDRVRARGWTMAVDNVGANPGSLALLPLLEPEIVKIDRSVVHRRARDVDRTLAVISSYASRSGAIILADGVDTEGQRRFALSIGAHLGQGNLFGSVTTRPPSTANTPVSLGIVPRDDWEIGTGGPTAPAWVLDRHPLVGEGDLPSLLAVSHRLERMVAASPDPSSILLATFQHRRRLGAESADRFGELARRVSLVGVLGVGMEPEPLPGVRGVSLYPEDPAAVEWDVVVVTPSLEIALISQEIQVGVDGSRRFRYLLTDESVIVRQAARILLRRFGRPD